MEVTNVVTEILVNILLGCFSLVTLSWILVAAQSFINDRKREKREQAHEQRELEQDKRDREYHDERMKQLLK